MEFLNAFADVATIGGFFLTCVMFYKNECN